MSSCIAAIDEAIPVARPHGRDRRRSYRKRGPHPCITIRLPLPPDARLEPPSASPPSLLACVPSPPSRPDADKRFQAIYEKEWTWRQEQTGQADEDTDTSGDNTRLPDVGAPAQQARLKVWEQVLKDLDGIDPAGLSAENRINLAIYRPQVENLVRRKCACARTRCRSIPIPRSGRTCPSWRAGR